MGDAGLIAHEILTHIKRKKQGEQPLATIKIDMNKAYDRIQWNFIHKILQGMNFPINWITWIMECITTVMYQILVNGEPSNPITPKCGLRQGDPLSSYLFILCMEVLSHQLLSLEERQGIKGIKISRRAPSISHLFFLPMMHYSSFKQTRKHAPN